MCVFKEFGKVSSEANPKLDLNKDRVQRGREAVGLGAVVLRKAQGWTLHDLWGPGKSMA